MEENLTYQKAFEELRQITEQIESDEVSVDELSAKVKRAAELLEICNAKLKNTQEEVQGIIDKMNAESK